MGKAFVTVGTTKFELLIETVLNEKTLNALKNVGITEVTLQIGAGNLGENAKRVFKLNDDHADQGITEDKGLRLCFYRYKPDIKSDMESATVIIGHAGAGTVLESMKLQKPTIVVVNDALMDNHQTELAEALAQKQHLLCCVPSNLADTVVIPTLFSLKPFNPPDQSKVARLIDSRVGLSSQQ